MKPAKLLAMVALWMICDAAALARPIVVGSISKDPVAESAVLQPIADYLAAELKGSGVTGGKVHVARSVADMSNAVKSGTVDLLFDSPYPTLAVSRAADSRVILRRWKGGKSGYRSLIVVHADSTVRTPRDLRGKVIAFEDPYSTSGFFLPASSLRKAGIKLREVKDAQTPVGPDEIGYLFSGKQENTLVWLQKGLVSGVGAGLHDYEKFRQDGSVQMRTVLETANVPRHLVSARKDLAPALVKRIAEILVAMEHSPEGKKVLHAFEETTRFDAVPADADAILVAMRRLMAEFEPAAAR